MSILAINGDDVRYQKMSAILQQLQVTLSCTTLQCANSNKVGQAINKPGNPEFVVSFGWIDEALLHTLAVAMMHMIARKAGIWTRCVCRGVH